MSILCTLFGHGPALPGWWGDVPYGEVIYTGHDNIGRIHGALYHDCRRCGVKYLAARLHLNDKVIVKALANDRPL